MQAGKLRHELTLKRPIRKPDAANQLVLMPDDPDATVGTVFGSVEGVAGGEVWRGFQVASETTSVVVIRYREDVTPQWWLEHDGRRLNIVRAQDPWGTREKLMIECMEGE